MNIEDMTPEQLREYATEKELKRRELEQRYVRCEEPAPVAPIVGMPKPWEKAVEFEGETYHVDMRRIKSREFIRMFAKFQEHQRGGEDATASEVLAIYDHVFGGDVDEAVTRLVIAKMGYEDFEEITRIESGILAELDVKN